MALTAAQIRCLLAILSLSRVGEDVASKDIARLLGISRPSVHKMLELLARENLLEKAHYGAARLTAAGEELTLSLEARAERLTLLFARRMGLDMDEAGRAAALLMAGLREDSLARLEADAFPNLGG